MAKLMTLDEAIKHCEEKAEELEEEAVKGCCDDTEIMNNCIKCAEEHRQLAEWLRELKKDRKILDGLRIYFQSLVVDAVFNQRPMMFDMRDATKEERESVKKYIADSVSTTGVNFWHLIGEVNADGERDSN